jgi:hypothetical protein
MVRAIDPTRRNETMEPSTARNLVMRPMERRLTIGQKNNSKTVKIFLLEMIQFL